MHRPQGSGARGGDQPHFPQSLEKNGGGTAPPAAVTRRCTTLTSAVYTGHAGATSFFAALGRGQVGTALGMVVPPDRVAVPT